MNNEQLINAIRNKEADKLKCYSYDDMWYDVISTQIPANFEHLLNNYPFKNNEEKKVIFLQLLMSDIEYYLKEDCIGAFLNHFPPEQLKVDFPEGIFTITQYENSFYVFKKLVENKFPLDHNMFLLMGCRNNQKEYLEFITQHFNVTDEILEQALDQIINSDSFGESSTDATQIYLIKYLLEMLNVNCKLPGTSDHDWLYQECFENVPPAAKYFYTDDFDIAILYDQEYWEYISENYLEDEDYESLYLAALDDIKNSNLDIDFKQMQAIFIDLNMPAAAQIFSH
ncbi:hypothetical protein [Shewanella algae]|uniref:hypothetical protein n=3 Tax=Shewanella algae TaxID=38313 RepID=UPI001AAC67B5|nr:hypothetical protein [Shewanella algae]MBO2616349.1 hypothetical protein [Shewanella algae]